MAYADLAAELAGVIPGLSPILAATFVRRAWREIRDERNWSFKTGQASIVCPAALTTGTASFTGGGNTVVMSPAATTALTPYITGVAGVPLLTQMQIRFTSAVAGGMGPLYRITLVTFTAPLTFTVDRPITEASATVATFMIYRAYIVPLVTDFTRWDSLQDFANGINISGPRLTRTSVYFDQMDPQRSSLGLASSVGSLVADTGGVPSFEMWPHPTQGQIFLATYRRTGSDFLVASDVQPVLIPDSLIMARAYGWHAYPWAQANRGRFPALSKTDFSGLTVSARQQYTFDLNTIRLQDDDLAQESVYNRGHWGGRGGRSGEAPLGDAKYWQSHPISW